MKGSRYSVILLIFALTNIPVFLGEEVQPANRTKEDHVTLNASLSTGLPYGPPLAVNSSTPATEEDSNVPVNQPLATAPPPPPQVLSRSGAAEDTSPEPQPPACIRSLVDLRQAYFDFKTASGYSPQDSTIFSFYPTDAVKYTSLAIFYSVSTVGDGDQLESFSLNPTRCCNPHNTSTCKVFLRYRSYLYRAIYPPLIYLFAFPPSPFLISKMYKSINTKLSKFGVRKLCWKVPPFCHPSKIVDRQSDHVLLKEFTAEFPHLVLSTTEGPIQVGPVEFYKPGDWEKDTLRAIKNERRLAVVLVILFVFIAITSLFLFAMDTYSATIGTVLRRSTFAVNCLYIVVMPQSLFWAFYFTFNTVQVLWGLLRLAQSDEKFFNELLMPDVVLYWCLFVVEMAVILIEFPFIFSYFWKSRLTDDADENRSGLRKVLKSVGWMGIVAFCQLGSAMMCCMVIFLFINPLYTITRAGNTVLFIAFFPFLFALCTLTCSLCTRQKCRKYFLVVMILLVIGSMSFLAFRVLPEPFTDHADHTDALVTGLISSVVSSVMLAVFGYVFKTLVWDQIAEEVQDDAQDFVEEA